MEIPEHMDVLAAEGLALASAAREAGTDALVPTCPDWRVRDLLRHTGMVHRWVTGMVVEESSTCHEAADEPTLDGEALFERFAEGHRLLVEALRAAPAGLECWTVFPARSPLAFWARRQAHETAIHRVDAESARGGTRTRIAAAHAEDGIDELLAGFHARDRSRVRTDSPRTLRIRAVDTDAVWTVRLSAGPPLTVRGATGLDSSADCTLSGTAEQLYLALWNRLPLSSVDLEGDRSVARLWEENSAVV
ncbi:MULTISPECIES: maleylpyruvate isomerase family mycothiol-dependent enzyme [unclassified Streptomyces]|uniref:maleylpyruvate isomerase family mycothiol-dependent enzyme n=1 Tax=unclassified Streptomyces TaxID=2593676 RepID=UPI002E13BDAC|nr:MULTISPECIES: maleylpyruvate isomerase family mycothiol-dependent enzyme [unclassified Streptomyces]WSQ88877.1 maleylpyruvate isomerase family mycothiol-dependent enzyme [Streptomyces sp. NBC_01212]WSR05118.1 maleylpyruvate isomerase family mycothiol-dependent enzyme [Streptomyces sp. NBC_01208]